MANEMLSMRSALGFLLSCSSRRRHTISVSAFLLNRSNHLRFQTALASIKLIQASAVLDLTEDDFDFLTSNKVWIATDRSRARRCVERSEERRVGKEWRSREEAKHENKHET